MKQDNEAYGRITRRMGPGNPEVKAQASQVGQGNPGGYLVTHVEAGNLGEYHDHKPVGVT